MSYTPIIAKVFKLLRFFNSLATQEYEKVFLFCFLSELSFALWLYLFLRNSLHMHYFLRPLLSLYSLEIYHFGRVLHLPQIITFLNCIDCQLSVVKPKIHQLLTNQTTQPISNR